jgi:hypothetical protein
MIPSILDRIRRFQDHLLASGLSQAVLALPAPRMLALAAPSSEASSAVLAKTVTEKEIIEVSRDLFASGHYSLAVQEAYKAVEKFVQSKANEHGLSGTKLIVADNANMNPDYLKRVRSADSGYMSVPFAEDVELSIRTG